MNRPVSKLLLLLCGLLSIAILNSVLLFDRHETIDFYELGEDNQSLIVDPIADKTRHQANYTWQLYLCGDEAHAHDFEKSLILADQPAEHVDLPREQFLMRPEPAWKLAHDYGERVRCTMLGNIDKHDALVPLNEGEFIVRLEQENSPLALNRCLILLALLFTALGIGYGWKQRDAMPKPNFLGVDAVSAFAVSLLISFGLSVFAFTTFRSSGFFVSKEQVLASSLATFIGLFGTAGMWYLWRTKRPVNAQTQAAEPASAASVNKILGCNPIILAPIAGFVLAILAIISLIFGAETEMTLHDMVNNFEGYGFALAHFAMLAPISEELLYRGVIQTAIGGRKTTGTRAWCGIVLAAAIFAAVHIPQSVGHPFTLLPVFSVGLCSGYLRQKTQTLFPSIALHLAYNSTLLLPSLL